jgi:hypothetical protein
MLFCNTVFFLLLLHDDSHTDDIDSQDPEDVPEGGEPPPVVEDPALKRVGSTEKSHRKASLDSLKRLASFGRKRKESLTPHDLPPTTPEEEPTMAEPGERYKNLPVFRVQQWDGEKGKAAWWRAASWADSASSSSSTSRCSMHSLSF